MTRDLVERAMTGDHGAFSELARASIGRLYVLARLILRDDARAEDATQEALVAAWRHIAGLRDPDRFEAWLRRLLVNACAREAARARQRRTREVSVRPLHVTEPDTSLGLADRDQLERGFRRLDADQRAVLVLHYYLGLSLDEAAEVQGVPAGTVRSRLHRATRAMRSALDADARSTILNEGRPA
jgi:RNA polymerase sigma-70 factor (ECF subfamily)